MRHGPGQGQVVFGVVMGIWLALASTVLAKANPGSTDLLAGPPLTTESKKALSVLFIGNSLTTTNNVPDRVQELFAAAGFDSEVEVLAGPNLGLEDHWGSRRVQKVLKRPEGWDFVILQQGPSATEGRPSLLEYSRRFAELVGQAGGRQALYMVWPSTQRAFDFPGVRESYADAARQTDSLLLRVGDAWRVAWHLDGDLRLYGADGFHPSEAGSYLAALVIFEGLSGREAPIDAKWQRRLGGEEFAVLRAAARAVRQGAIDAVPEADLQ